MELIITGRLQRVLQLESGTGKTGKEWKKQDFLIETNGEYPTLVLLTAWGKATEFLANFTTGTLLSVTFNPASREHNGKFYTSLNANKIHKVEGATQATAPVSASAPTTSYATGVDDSDLPF